MAQSSFCHMGCMLSHRNDESNERGLAKRKMIIVKLNGGLGNQLFQYAAGRRISVLHGTPIKLDLTIFEHHKLRHYSLEAFRIQESFATPQEIAEAQNGIGGVAGRGKRPLWSRLKRRHQWTVVREDYLGPYDPGILEPSENVYLDGYWQSEKYFADIQDLIRREFIVRYEQDSQSAKIAEGIARTDSVSVHFRGADYLSDPETHHTHGVCEPEYYEKAVRILQEKIASPHFFVFSDDPSWCEKNLHFDHPVTFITHNSEQRAYEDLRLMSLCKHNIIANSSFSWWGAWLNANKDKVVVAPNRWFSDPRYDTGDIIPDGWLKI